MPKVSIIIPVYNGSLYLPQAIESVLAQTYSDYEIIVVDDGSTEDIPTTVEPYCSQITYIHQINSGVAVARNRGLEKANGEYIAFLDQDDYFLPQKLALQVELMQRQPDLSFVSSGWQIVDCEGKGITAVEPWYGMNQLDLTGILIWKPVFLGAMLFRGSWLSQIGGFNSELQQTSDVELVMRLAATGGLGAWVEQVTVCYRQHQHNVSKNSLEQAQELQSVLDQFFYRPDLAPEIKRLESPSRYQSLVWSAWRLHQTNLTAEMAAYLVQSLHYSPGTATETVIDWLHSFKKYTAEYGTSLDVSALIRSSAWQRLIQTVVLR